MSHEEVSRRHLRAAVAVGAVLCIGLVARIVYVSELEGSAYANVLSLDSRFYRELALSMLGGEKLPVGALTFNPLYPLFLVVVFKLFGRALLAPRLVQAFLGLATIAITAFAAGRLVEGPRARRPSAGVTAVAAALIAALYAPFVLYEGMLVSTAIEVFLVAAAFALSLALDHDLQGLRELRVAGRRIPPRLSAFVLGLALGAGALGRPNLFLLLIAAIPLWLVVKHRRRGRGLVPAAACLFGAFLFLLPPVLYNARVTGRLVPVSAHGGINFYIGNRPGTPGTYDPPADMRADMRGLIEDARERAEADVGGRLTDADVSSYYFRQTLALIEADPRGWLRLLGRKLLLFWNNSEVSDLPNAYFYERACPVLRLLFIPFSLIAALGVAGLVVLTLSGRNRSVTFVFTGAALASVVLFYVNTRYRLPFVPVLALAAAFFVAWCLKQAARRRVRRLLLGAALAAGMIVVSTRPLVHLNASAAYTFLGNFYVENNREKPAEDAFTEAYRLDPNKVESMINYARVLRKRDELQAAADLYARAYEIMPRFPRLAAEYGSVLEKLGKREEARELYLQAFSSTRARERFLACRLLANLALAEKNRYEAHRWVTAGLEIVPGDPTLTKMRDWLESPP